jgi:hypothetical protein
MATTAVITEDDDSGVDTNAWIPADLISGRCCAQVRRHNRTGGLGKHTVEVRRA